MFSTDSPFLALDDPHRKDLFSRLTLHKFNKGQFIHHAGDKADGVYCVLAGKVRISTCSVDGHYILVKDLCPGDWFGFMGLFGDGMRPQDATVVSYCKIAYMKTDDFNNFLTIYPLIYRKLLTLMSQYSTHFFDNFTNAVSMPLCSRVAKMLCRLADWQNTSKISITQADLAAFLGVTREAVGVQLNKLQQQGIIQLQYKKIILLDKTSLNNDFG